MFKNLLYINNDNHDLQVHHEYSKFHTENSEASVKKILDYFHEKLHFDPFAEGEQPLRNISSQEIVHNDIANKILNIFEIGTNAYLKFLDNRFNKDEPL